MTSKQGATNYRDYYEFIYLNTHLTLEEAFAECAEYWNRGVNKYDLLKIINERK